MPRRTSTSWTVSEDWYRLITYPGLPYKRVLREHTAVLSIRADQMSHTQALSSTSTAIHYNCGILYRDTVYSLFLPCFIQFFEEATTTYSVRNIFFISKQDMFVRRFTAAKPNNVDVLSDSLARIEFLITSWNFTRGIMPSTTKLNSKYFVLRSKIEPLLNVVYVISTNISSIV